MMARVLEHTGCLMEVEALAGDLQGTPAYTRIFVLKCCNISYMMVKGGLQYEAR